MNANKLFFLVCKIRFDSLRNSENALSEVNLFYRPEKQFVYIHSTLHARSTFTCIAGSSDFPIKPDYLFRGGGRYPPSDNLFRQK